MVHNRAVDILSCGGQAGSDIDSFISGKKIRAASIIVSVYVLFSISREREC
jgi:hypothetical protein